MVPKNFMLQIIIHVRFASIHPLDVMRLWMCNSRLQTNGRFCKESKECKNIWKYFCFQCVESSYRLIVWNIFALNVWYPKQTYCLNIFLFWMSAIFLQTYCLKYFFSLILNRLYTVCQHEYSTWRGRHHKVIISAWHPPDVMKLWKCGIMSKKHFFLSRFTVGYIHCVQMKMSFWRSWLD